jgi:hypothetical protein
MRKFQYWVQKLVSLDCDAERNGQLTKKQLAKSVNQAFRNAMFGLLESDHFS